MQIPALLETEGERSFCVCVCVCGSIKGVMAHSTKHWCHITVERPVCQMTAGVAEKRIRFYYLHVCVCAEKNLCGRLTSDLCGCDDSSRSEGHVVSEILPPGCSWSHAGPTLSCRGTSSSMKLFREGETAQSKVKKKKKLQTILIVKCIIIIIIKKIVL